MFKDLQSQNKKTKIFLKNNFNKADWVIGAIDQRRKTLYKVMKEIINHQPDFFDGNIDKLMPMRLKDISDILGLDVSTISRSTRGKYVETPYGIFELKYFFTDNHTLFDGKEISVQEVKLALKKIVENEDKDNPLNDDDLKEELKKSGYSIARRTVAKYRDQLNLPSARLRRKI
jgi:RNA polymerase sigma-54 factor